MLCRGCSVDKKKGKKTWKLGGRSNRVYSGCLPSCMKKPISVAPAKAPLTTAGWCWRTPQQKCTRTFLATTDLYDCLPIFATCRLASEIHPHRGRDGVGWALRRQAMATGEAHIDGHIKCLHQKKKFVKKCKKNVQAHFFLAKKCKQTHNINTTKQKSADLALPVQRVGQG